MKFNTLNVIAKRDRTIDVSGVSGIHPNSKKSVITPNRMRIIFFIYLDLIGDKIKMCNDASQRVMESTIEGTVSPTKPV